MARPSRGTLGDLHHVALVAPEERATDTECAAAL